MCMSILDKILSANDTTLPKYDLKEDADEDNDVGNYNDGAASGDAVASSSATITASSSSSHPLTLSTSKNVGVDATSGIKFFKKMPMVLQDNLTNGERDGKDSVIFKALLERMEGDDENVKNVSEDSKKKVGRYLGIDCEMVGIGPKGYKSALARVSIVNYYGHVILDKFVRPLEKITDFRTEFSGITPSLLKNGKFFYFVTHHLFITNISTELAEDFIKVQEEVAKIVADKVLIGHSIKSDLSALNISHPPNLIRDTSHYLPHKQFYFSHTLKQKKQRQQEISMENGSNTSSIDSNTIAVATPNKLKSPPLKFLAKEILGFDIQRGANGHSSVEDARVTIMLYRKRRTEWEEAVRRGQMTGKLHTQTK